MSGVSNSPSRPIIGIRLSISGSIKGARKGTTKLAIRIKNCDTAGFKWPKSVLKSSVLPDEVYFI